MDISSQVTKPLLSRLLMEYHNLEREIDCFGTGRTDALKEEVFGNISRLRRLDKMGDGLSASDREDVRKMKLDLRFLQRRMRRAILSEERLRRSQARTARLTPHFAA